MASTFDGVQSADDAAAASRESLLTKFARRAYDAWCYFSFSHVNALLDKGAARSLDQFSATEFHPKGVHPKQLLKEFNSFYAPLKVMHLRCAV